MLGNKRETKFKVTPRTAPAFPHSFLYLQFCFFLQVTNAILKHWGSTQGHFGGSLKLKSLVSTYVPLNFPCSKGLEKEKDIKTRNLKTFPSSLQV